MCPVVYPPRLRVTFCSYLESHVWRLCSELFFLCQEACKLGTAFVKLQGEHEALKKKNDEDNGKVMFPVANEVVGFFHHKMF